METHSSSVFKVYKKYNEILFVIQDRAKINVLLKETGFRKVQEAQSMYV